MLGLQYSIHRPSSFIHHHWADLLPDWRVGVASLLVILQPSSVELYETNQATEQQKRRLRRRSLLLAKALILRLHQAGYAAETFDPRTGRPYHSRSGLLTLDDVAVVQAVLGYPLVTSGHCRVIEHPVWGSSVFPSVVVSTADPLALADIAHELWRTHRTIEPSKDLVPAFGDGKDSHRRH
jgi:hypothetical protein